MKVLFVLMWHHLMVRKRKIFVTFFDLIIPLMAFVVLFKLTDFIMNPEKHQIPSKYTTEAGELSLHDYVEDPVLRSSDPRLLSLILYTPSTEFTDELMDRVGKKLDLDRLYSFPDPTSEGYFACFDISASSNPRVAKLIKQMDDRSAVVLFSDAARNRLTLNYTIKMNVDFYIDDYLYAMIKDRSHIRFAALNELFLRLQWAIDSSFIELRTLKSVDRDIYLQEVPLSDALANTDTETKSKKIKYEILGHCIRFISCGALYLTYTFLVMRLLEYRSSGLEELIKMIGVTPTMLKLSHFINVLPVGLLYVVCGVFFMKVPPDPVLPKTDPILIVILLILHFTSVMLLAFVMSHVTDSNDAASILAMLSYIGCFIICEILIIIFNKIPKALRMIFGVIPFMPHLVFWKHVELEYKGVGPNVANMFQENDRHFSPFLCFVLLIIQIVIFLGLTCYLAKVRPGPYGIALPLCFLFHPSYWRKKKSLSEELAMTEEVPPVSQNPNYFEPVDYSADIGLKIIDVSKVYGKKIVLSHVTFDAYKGEITLLLGHNGAGKTTLISIITGMTSMTSGTVLVNGISLATHPKRVRSQIGFCPQHNLLVPNLSVQQQVVFFAMLKGEGYQEANTSSKELLKELRLESKLDMTADGLSGGMKRRLQLACALAGGSSVLILDEPTSGMDVETRREFWDTLLVVRGKRTILLTTHYMEEADVLGDRVAALNGGMLQCYGSPMFLKKSIGEGYRLSLTTTGLPEEEAITRAVTSVIPQAKVAEKSYNSILYTLPSQDSSKFPQLFSLLENQRSALKIESIGVGLSTLDDVFLKLCSDTDTEFTAEAVDTSIPERSHNVSKGGIGYYLRVMCLLMLRHLRYLKNNKYSFLFWIILLPVIINYILMTLVVMSDNDDWLANATKKSLRRPSKGLDLFSRGANERVLYQGARRTGLRTWEPKYKDIDLNITQDLDNSEILSATLRTVSHDNKYIAGIDLNETHAKILYTGEMRHAAPIALNMLSNILAARTTPYLSINTYYEPLTNSTQFNYPKPLNLAALLLWVGLSLLIFHYGLLNAVTLPLEERRVGTRHIHLMAGCPPLLLWMTTLVAHTLTYGLFLMLPMLLFTLMDKQTINNVNFVGTMILILLLGTTAWLSKSYAMHFQDIDNCVPVKLDSIAYLGVVITSFTCLAEVLDMQMYLFVDILMKIYSFCWPPIPTVTALCYSVTIAYKNDIYNLIKYKCKKNSTLKLCAIKYQCYLCMGDRKPVLSIIMLIGHTILYMSLVVLQEYGIFNKIYEKGMLATYKGMQHPPRAFNNPSVNDEKAYVDKTIDLPPEEIPDAILISDVYKMYMVIENTINVVWIQAVRGISFSVKKGECFGLLGVNGAGKSSAFKMITAAELPMMGRCFANKRFLHKNRLRYMRSLSYCPQFFGMDEFMTGRENLRLLLQLSGLPWKYVNLEVNVWLSVAGLKRYADVLVKQYSGGCKRRLAATAALAMGSTVTLLDEPTAGVDVAARRCVWLAMRKGMRNQRSIVLTSHSMDEIEALCDRIAVMVSGEFAALGTSRALRAAHAKGYAVRLKLRPPPVTPGDPISADPVKKAIEQKFTCRLTDEHKTMLHYHIEDTVNYSELFQFMEDLKKSFSGVLEDYTISEASLEEVFLSFSQKHSENRSTGTKEE